VVGLRDQRLRRGLRLVGAERRPAFRHGDAQLLEDLLGLVLVDLHGRAYNFFPASITSRTAAADLSSIAFSSAVSSMGTIFSTPAAPITIGTPRYMSLCP